MGGRLFAYSAASQEPQAEARIASPFAGMSQQQRASQPGAQPPQPAAGARPSAAWSPDAAHAAQQSPQVGEHPSPLQPGSRPPSGGKQYGSLPAPEPLLHPVAWLLAPGDGGDVDTAEASGATAAGRGDAWLGPAPGALDSRRGGGGGGGGSVSGGEVQLSSWSAAARASLASAPPATHSMREPQFAAHSEPRWGEQARQESQQRQQQGPQAPWSLSSDGWGGGGSPVVYDLSHTPTPPVPPLPPSSQDVPSTGMHGLPGYFPEALKPWAMSSKL